jgi:hypothetical protein
MKFGMNIIPLQDNAAPSRHKNMQAQAFEMWKRHNHLYLATIQNSPQSGSRVLHYETVFARRVVEITVKEYLISWQV